MPSTLAPRVRLAALWVIPTLSHLALSLAVCWIARHLASGTTYVSLAGVAGASVGFNLGLWGIRQLREHDRRIALEQLALIRQLADDCAIATERLALTIERDSLGGLPPCGSEDTGD